MDEQRQRWLIENAPALADELARLPFLPETGGDAHLNIIIPTLRALVAATAARQAQDDAAREIVQALAGVEESQILFRGAHTTWCLLCEADTDNTDNNGALIHTDACPWMAAVLWDVAAREARGTGETG